MCPSFTSSQGPLVLTERRRETRGELDGTTNVNMPKQNIPLDTQLWKETTVEEIKNAAGSLVIKPLGSINIKHIGPLTSPARPKSKMTSFQTIDMCSKSDRLTHKSTFLLLLNCS